VKAKNNALIAIQTIELLRIIQQAQSIEHLSPFPKTSLIHSSFDTTPSALSVITANLELLRIA